MDLSWPILRSVADTKNLDLVADDFVDCDVGPRSKHEFAGILGQSNSSADGNVRNPATLPKMVSATRRAAAGSSLRMYSTM